jgi:UDP-glucose 4-epimerase
MLSKERHLIVGGGGFLGRHVALLLANYGHSVQIASRTPPHFQFPKSFQNIISWVQCDVRNVVWSEIISNVDVIHYYAWSTINSTASSDPVGDLESNVVPLVSMLQAVAGLNQQRPRIIFSSSGGTVYGVLKQLPVMEDHQTEPISPYGVGKRSAELYLGSFRAMHDLDCRVARIANPFGIGQNLHRGQGAVSKFIDCALTNRPIDIWGDGNVIRDFIHITDVANALIAIANFTPKLDSPWIFNVGSGQAVRINDVVASLERIIDRKILVNRYSGRAFDLSANVLDINRAKLHLSWRPLLSLDAGIARTISDHEQSDSFSTFD